MGFSLFKRIKNLASTSTGGQEPSTELLIQNVRQGGVIALRAVGETLEDFDLKVMGRHTYRQGDYEWYELECDKGGQKVWIDLEEDDEIELAIGMRQLDLKDLGLSKKDLDKMDEEEEGEFTFEGQIWTLDDSDSANFLRNGDESKKEKLYYWDFVSEDGKKFIGVEKWSNTEYAVTLSDTLSPGQVTVYSIR